MTPQEEIKELNWQAGIVKEYVRQLEIQNRQLREAVQVLTAPLPLFPMVPPKTEN